MKYKEMIVVEKSFKQEIKKQIRFAITAAIGFIIAYAWRESVFELFLSMISLMFNISPDKPTTKIYTAIVITIIGVLLIFLTSRLLRDKPKSKK